MSKLVIQGKQHESDNVACRIFKRDFYIRLFHALECCNNRGQLKTVVIGIKVRKGMDVLCKSDREPVKLAIRQMLLNNWNFRNFTWSKDYQVGKDYDFINDEFHPVRRFQSLVDVSTNRMNKSIVNLWTNLLIDEVTTKYQPTFTLTMYGCKRRKISSTEDYLQNTHLSRIYDLIRHNADICVSQLG